jgi:hypothetical protein
MAKQANNKTSKFGTRSNKWVKAIKTDIQSGRNNQYKFTALVMLDYLSRLPNRLGPVTAKEHFRGVHANSISGDAKTEIIEFMTTENDIDPNDVRSISYLGKIWGTSKGVMFHATKNANKGKYGKYETDKDGNATKQFVIDCNKMIKAIESGKVVINIAGETTRTVKGDGTNGTDPKKSYLVTADNMWADVDENGNAKPIVKKATSNKVEDCNNEVDVARVKAHWLKKLAEAQTALEALAVKKAQLKKVA